MSFDPCCRWTAGLILAALLGCGGGIAAPKSYTTLSPKDGAFQCDCPAGWESGSGGSAGILSQAHFSSGSASVEITADTKGSLIADIAQSTGGAIAGIAGVEEEDKEPPVVMLHEMGKDEFTQDLGSYKEQPPSEPKTALGPARMSEFTASGSLGGKLHGYRAMIHSSDRRVTVMCQCSESDWATLKPVFERVINSMAPGSPR